MTDPTRVSRMVCGVPHLVPFRGGGAMIRAFGRSSLSPRPEDVGQPPSQSNGMHLFLRPYPQPCSGFVNGLAGSPWLPRQELSHHRAPTLRQDPRHTRSTPPRQPRQRARHQHAIPWPPCEVAIPLAVLLARQRVGASPRLQVQPPRTLRPASAPVKAEGQYRLSNTVEPGRKGTMESGHSRTCGSR